MKRPPLAIEVLAVGVAVTLLHAFLSERGLYWSVSWVDTLAHFLGGVWIGLLSMFVFFTAAWVHLPSDNRRVVAAVTLLSVLAVGLGWELYEVYSGLSNVHTDTVDTLSDLSFDMLGGLCALWYFRSALVRHPAAS